jgi:hypothetical protein
MVVTRRFPQDEAQFNRKIFTAALPERLLALMLPPGCMKTGSGSRGLSPHHFVAFAPFCGKTKSAFIRVHLRLNALRSLRSLRLKSVCGFGVVRGLLLFAGFARLGEPDDGTSGNKNDLTVLLFQFHVS